MTSIRRCILSVLPAFLPLAARAKAPAPNDDWLAPGPARPMLPVGESLPARIRVPEFPLKDARTLFSAAEIAQARVNVARYPAAQAVAAALRKEADYWVDWPDEALRDVVPGAEVPRAFDLASGGCPVHGKAIFSATGSTYPWIVDPKDPFRVKCPIGGESYPSNDYGRFYRSGYRDRSDFKGPYVDDGHGWLAPNGQRFWFVAYAAHWLWFEHAGEPHHNLCGGLAALGRTYLLTGDPRYAHKAAVLLRRIAEVYPNMDYESQSPFGTLLAKKDGTRYTGKVLNAIWETYLIGQLAETYDAIWPSIDGDLSLQKFYGQGGRELRSFIEANVLEEGIDSYFDKRMRGNYGMHQRALLVLAIVRQHGDTPRYLHAVLDRPDGTVYLGLRTALSTLIWRDGEPYESPFYNFLWVQNITAEASLLPRLGVDVSSLPRLRRIYDPPLESIAIGRHTPAVGDTSTVYGGVVGEDAAVYQQAFRTYADPRYLAFLAGFGAGGAAGFRDFASLLHPVLPTAQAPPDGRRVPPQRPRLLSGFGLALLNNRADDVGVSIYFGQHVSHAHYDRLHFDLYANGQPMTPDLGYPDAMNEYLPGIFTWSLHTVSHNTVMVDENPQPGNKPGTVEMMVDGRDARVIDVSAAGTYPQCGAYRRALVMVDTGPHKGYFVDFFTVAGGKEHFYSLHGPPGTFGLEGGNWTSAARGTLAGERVGPDEIYDDPVLGAPGYTGGFAGYHGSGFQHFSRVQRHLGGTWTANYAHERDPAAKLQVRILEEPGETVMVADAQVSPVKYPQRLKYLLVRHAAAAPGECLRSVFVSLLDPHSGQPALVAAGRQAIAGGTVVTARRRDGRIDVVAYGFGPEPKAFAAAGHSFSCAAVVTVATFRAAGGLERLFFAGGPRVAVDGRTYDAAPRAAGRVARIEPAQDRVVVDMDPGLAFAAGDAAALVGRVMRFDSPTGTTTHTVMSAALSGRELSITTKDDLLVGQFRVETVNGDKLMTRTHLVLAGSYAGTTVIDGARHTIGLVQSASDDRVTLAARPEGGAALAGRDLWLTSVATGDRMEVPLAGEWSDSTVAGIY